MVCAIIYNYNIPVFIYLIIHHFIYALMQISINQLVILHRYKNTQQCTSMHGFLLSDLQQLTYILETTDILYILQISQNWLKMSREANF